jgi:hypothetical protein
VATAAETGPPAPPPAPPSLPTRWLDMRPLLVIGTVGWFVAWCVLLVARYGYHVATGVWLPTCLAGWLLGIGGLVVTYWQRSAARRGSRGAQRV